MAITEESRHQLFQLFETTYGREGALLIMEFLPPVGWADVATKSDLVNVREVLSHDLLASTNELRAEMAEFRGDLRAEMAEFRGELRAEIGSLRADLHAELRNLYRQLLLALAATLITVVLSSAALN